MAGEEARRQLHKNVTIHIHMQKQADSVVSDMNGFINFWLWSMATRGERQFLKVFANHTMLTPHPTCSLFCGVYDLCR